MLRLAFDFIITWRETRTRPNAYKVLDGITQIIAYAKHKAHGDKYHREKRQPAKPGNGYGMHFAPVRYVEQAFLVGNQQDFGNDCHPKYQCQ